MRNLILAVALALFAAGASAQAPAYAETFPSRTITLIANSVFGAILGAIGWALGGLLPPAA